MLHALADDERRTHLSVGDVLAVLGERALAVLLFVFAAPNVLPAPPGASVLLGTPLVLLAAQLTFGLRPWLPSVIARRTMSRSDFAALLRRIDPWLARTEPWLRPRAVALTLPPMLNLVGLVCLLLALVLVLPIPLGNMLPGLAICLLALGILQRDGLWVILGLATAVVAAVVVSGVVFAVAQAIVYLLGELMG